MSVPPTDPNRQPPQSGATPSSEPPAGGLRVITRERLPSDVEREANEIANRLLRALEEEHKQHFSTNG